MVDDGSTDGSREVLAEYGDKVLLQPLPSNQGPIAARNRGAAQAKGAYLVFLDGDDAYMPWALDVYDRLIAERKPSVILAATRWFDGDIHTLKSEDVPHTVRFVAFQTLLRKHRGVGLSAS